MVKIQGENGIKVTNLIKSISELYYTTEKEALRLLVNAITSSKVINVIQHDIEQQLNLRSITK